MKLNNLIEVETLSIVVVGDINPTIIQPFWLFSKKLIREEEASNASIEIIHNEIVKWELDWVSLEITKNRCQLKTNKKPYFDLTRDLAASIFKILKETPLHSLGINHIYDLSLQNKEQYYKFGNSLSPLNNWDDSLNDPRLLQLEIIENERKDNYRGKYRIRVSPADKNISFGVSININDHYVFQNENSNNGMGIIQILETKWEYSFQRSEKIVNNLLEKIL